MPKLQIEVSARTPVFIDVDARQFGVIFAGLNDEDQIATLQAMVDAMSAHPIQWDFISIALEKPENRALRDTLRQVLFPTEGADHG